MIEIQHGCLSYGGGKYVYSTITSPSGNPNDVKINSYDFTAENNEKPEVGDFIVNMKLVKRTTPKVNSDWSRWKDKDLYGAP